MSGCPGSRSLLLESTTSGSWRASSVRWGSRAGVGCTKGTGPASQGMLREVFVELCEMLVPKWARKDM